MNAIPDDPIISCIERTGYPPWMQEDYSDEEADDDEEKPDADDISRAPAAL